MRVSTRFLLASLLLAGLWTWSGAAVLCASGVELSAAPTCCPGECHCVPSSCGCTLAPAKSRPEKETAPALLPEGLKESIKPELHTPALPQAQIPVVLHDVEVRDWSAWVATSTKHAEALLDLFCVQLV